MNRPTLTKLILSLFCVFALTACVDKYFEDPTLELYTRNFIREFGLVDPDQDWNMAKACEVSINVGSTRASSVKIYGKYNDQYYLCADLTNIRGQLKVPVDVPKSTEEMLVVVDGRNYLGNINNLIDCTGAPAKVSRSEGDSPLITSDNIRVKGNPSSYTMSSWTHVGNLNRSFTLEAKDGNYSNTTVTIAPTNGALLGENRRDAIYTPDPSYQLINAQQVDPLVSKESWKTDYWSMGSGYNNYNGDHNIGFVPEGGVGDIDYDGDGKMNNVKGNTENTGVTQNFTFELEGDKFTVYPMFYGTNLVHILGFYLLDDDEKPILDENGNVLKFPIYKTKQGDDILVKDARFIDHIGIAQASSSGEIYLTEGTDKLLKINLYNDNGDVMSKLVNYDQVTINNSNTSYFTLKKGDDGITLHAIKECENKEATITYRGKSFTLKVSVESRNAIYNVRVNNATLNGGTKELKINKGSSKEVTFDFYNSAGEKVTTLTNEQKNVIIDRLAWTSVGENNIKITRTDHKINIQGVAESETVVHFWIPGKSESDDTNGVKVIVEDPIKNINLGVVEGTAPNYTLLNDGTLNLYLGQPKTVTVVNIVDATTSPIQVTTIDDIAWDAITVGIYNGATYTKNKDNKTITITGTSISDDNGYEAGVYMYSYNKSAKFKLKVTKDPTALASFDIHNDKGAISAVTTPIGTDLSLTLVGSDNSGAKYTFKSADVATITYDEGVDSYFTLSQSAGTLTVHPIAEGSGKAKVKIGTAEAEITVTVTDPIKLASMKLVNEDDEDASPVTLKLSTPQTFKLKGTNAGGGTYTFTADDQATVTYSSGADVFEVTQSAGNVTLTPKKEGTGKATLIIGAASTDIEVTVVDASKITSLKLVNTNGTSLPDEMSLEPTQYYDIKVKGLNAFNEDVLTDSQFNNLKLMFGSYGHNSWDSSESCDFLTVSRISDHVVRITATSVNSNGKGFYVELGDVYSAYITIKTQYTAAHTLNNIEILNANVSYTDNNSNSGTGLVVKNGSSVAINIKYLNSNSEEISKEYGCPQLNTNWYSSQICNLTKQDNYFIVTGTNTGSSQIQFNVGSKSISIAVMPADYTGDVSADPRSVSSTSNIRGHKTTKAPIVTGKPDKTEKVKVKKPAQVGSSDFVPVSMEPTFTYKPSKKVRFLTDKERKSWEQKMSKKRRESAKVSTENYNVIASRADNVPATLTYDENTDWQDINKIWTNETDVASFKTNEELLVRVRGYDVTITGGLPHKKVGLYIDVLDNPDYGTDIKEQIYYTGLYPTSYSKGYPEYSFSSSSNPFNYTHYSQQMLNIYVARDYDHERKNDIVAGDTKFAYSYGCAYKHPVSERTFFSFEDWPIKHPSQEDVSLTGNIKGYKYVERDFWGLEDNNKGDDQKQKYTGDYSSDRDLNDLVFVMYGAAKVGGDKPFTTIKTTDEFSWIWALEDLGATDDFDFNDLVMRVSSVTMNVKKTIIPADSDAPSSAPSRDGETDTDTDDNGIMYKKVTFTPLCAGGTLPIYVRYGDLTLKPGHYAADDVVAYFNENDGKDGFVAPTGYEGLTDLIGEHYTDEYEYHRWFGVNNSGTMINTFAGSQRRTAESCVLYLCTDDTHNRYFTISNFGSSNVVAANDKNDAKLYIVVDDGRDHQYEYGTSDAPVITDGWNKENGIWKVTPPEIGKVTQMFMIHDDNWRWPSERRHILDAYPTFSDWVSDRTTKWYTNGNSDYLY